MYNQQNSLTHISCWKRLALIKRSLGKSITPTRWPEYRTRTVYTVKGCCFLHFYTGSDEKGGKHLLSRFPSIWQTGPAVAEVMWHSVFNTLLLTSSDFCASMYVSFLTITQYALKDSFNSNPTVHAMRTWKDHTDKAPQILSTGTRQRISFMITSNLWKACVPTTNFFQGHKFIKTLVWTF